MVFVKSTATDCSGGGLNIANGGGYTIENDVVADNGNAGSSVGGVHLSGANGSFRHNTVTDNSALLSFAHAGAVG